MSPFVLFIFLSIFSFWPAFCGYIHTSCVGLDDGEYWLHLMDGEEYPPVKLKCSNHYAILDYNQDMNLKNYFSTWVMWHYAIAGPLNGDVVNWAQWYKPSTAVDHNFLVSPDCTSCDAESGWQKFDTYSTYWMSGNLFGCFWSMKAMHDCDMDYDTYQCYSCFEFSHSHSFDDVFAVEETTSESQYKWTGLCVDSVRSADNSVPQTHDDCTEQVENAEFKPSIGTDGRFCVCAQPNSSPLPYYIDDMTLETYETLWTTNQNSKIEVPTTKTSTNNIVYLYSKDFVSGTYRITEPGTYIIMEDIEFDFNAGDSSDPQDAWMPTLSQADEYPGAGQYRDTYFLGFFAGISVETNDVIIDLNQHELKQSEIFYYQQRWFALIELASQQFLPGQGPGFFGHDPQFASNVVIKNGYLGLTSHHGIHGNYNKDLTIENLVVKNFETHGIQLNGFDNVVLNNVEVGPTSQQVYLRAEYGHMRYMLPRLRAIAEENPDGTIQYSGRDEVWTAATLADELEIQLNLAFNYAVYGTVPEDETDSSWVSAKSVFINENGIPYGSVQHGIFLNTEGTSVFNYNLHTTSYSTSISLIDVKIHGMRHKMTEWVRFSYAAEVFATAVNSPIDAGACLGDKVATMSELEVTNPPYKGNFITDIWMAMGKLSNNWGILGTLLVGNELLIPWATGEDDYPNYVLGCNVDPMLHSGKGVLGLRIDGVSDLTINNLEVYDLEDLTPLGLEVCGEYSRYSSTEGGGHFRQVKPMQEGFSGNMVQAIAVNSAQKTIFENINIHDITSHNGPVFGIAIWPSNEVTLKSDITVYNLYAGIDIEEGTYSYSDRPNKAPEACAVMTYLYFEDSGNTYTTTVTVDDNANIQTGCIVGHIGCRGNDVVTDLGETDAIDSCTSKQLLSSSSTTSSSFMKSFSKLHKSTLLNIIFAILITSILFILFKSYCKCQQTEKQYSLIQTNSNGNYGAISL